MAAKRRQNRSPVPKSWHGRLTGRADRATAELLASLDVDRALWRYDIAGSLAHAKMLAKVGLLDAGWSWPPSTRGLAGVARDIQAGRLAMPVELEDIHMVIEQALIDRIGPVGGKLHTGRSRNDQVATDLRLWARDAIDGLREGIAGLQRALVALAKRQGKLVMPALHASPAGPADRRPGTRSWRTWRCSSATPTAWPMRGCAWTSARWAAGRWRARRCRWTAAPRPRRLGFAAVSRNSIDATADRDFLAELCFCCAMLAVHLSRWAEDWIVYSTTRVRLGRAARRLLHLQLHDAAEEERRHAGADPRQGGWSHRPAHRDAGAAEGPAAGLQPRPPGR